MWMLLPRVPQCIQLLGISRDGKMEGSRNAKRSLQFNLSFMWTAVVLFRRRRSEERYIIQKKANNFATDPKF
jgi:hypothetical protein